MINGKVLWGSGRDLIEVLSNRQKKLRTFTRNISKDKRCSGLESKTEALSKIWCAPTAPFSSTIHICRSMLVYVLCVSLTFVIHLAQELTRVACIRESPGTNVGQHSDHSESISSGFFSIPAVNYGIIAIDRRNKLPSIITLPNLHPLCTLPITMYTQIPTASSKEP